ncbi:MAG: 1,4-dihydroxy-2-naphthoate octaprenyltransferase [Verrucomicrobia bacterium GWC2_42_7]|nr:MAG: 1,4-dihydroxy-2-naphthoate octaprenyltransferase [Verrucomicrobia bacterium GWC2_42_7]
MWNVIKVITWVKAARPETLIASVAPVVLGNVLSWKYGFLDVGKGAICLLLAVFLQVGCNFANDYYDFLKGVDKPHRKGPPRLLAEGLVTPAGMFRAMIVSFFLAAVMGVLLIFTGKWWFSLIIIVSIISAYFYTGGKYPLAYHGWGDVFVFVFFGPVAVMGTFFVQTYNFSLDTFILSACLGLLIDNILIINNCRDVEEDTESKKRTSVVRLGRSFGIYHFTANGVMASLLPLGLLSMRYSPLISLNLLFLPLFLWFGLKLQLAEKGADYNKLLSLAALTVAIYTSMQCVSVLA